MANVIIVEKRSTNAPGWVYTWKCPACDCEWHHLKMEKQTFLECSNCGQKIYRTSMAKDEWETK